MNMELLTPEPSLILWVLLFLAHIIVLMVALIQIGRSNSRETNERLMWVLIVLFLPLAGSILYFYSGKKANKL